MEDALCVSIIGSLTAFRVVDFLYFMGNGIHIPKDGLQSVNSVFVQRNHICGVCVIAARNLYRKDSEYVNPVRSGSLHHNIVIALRCLQFLQSFIVGIVDLRHGNRHRYTVLTATSRKENAEGRCCNSRHKDQAEEHDQQNYTSTNGQNTLDRGQGYPPDCLGKSYRGLSSLGSSLLCPLTGLLNHLFPRLPTGQCLRLLRRRNLSLDNPTVFNAQFPLLPNRSQFGTVPIRLGCMSSFAGRLLA